MPQFLGRLLALGEVAVGGAATLKFPLAVNDGLADVADPSDFAAPGADAEFQLTLFRASRRFGSAMKVALASLAVLGMDDAGQQFRRLQKLRRRIAGEALARRRHVSQAPVRETPVFHISGKVGDRAKALFARP